MGGLDATSGEIASNNHWEAGTTLVMYLISIRRSREGPSFEHLQQKVMTRVHLTTLLCKRHIKLQEQQNTKFEFSFSVQTFHDKSSAKEL